MTEEEFEILTIKSEGETVDFKKEQYDLIKSSDDNKAKFVKDIVSFANTIRKESAFIVIGIESTINGKIFHGLKSNIDDAVLQDQVKTRLYPIPQFSYTTINYKGLEYGVIEIPLKRYPEPIASVVKMKGLEPGKIYMRRGSSNSEAVGKEVLVIDKWIKSIKLDNNIRDEIDDIIKEIHSGQKKLSYSISLAFKLTNQIENEELIRFCKGELGGWYNRVVEINDTNLPTHRRTILMGSLHKISSVKKLAGQAINFKSELQKDKNFREMSFLFQESIHDIELTLESQYGNDGYLTSERNLKDFIPGINENVPWYFYSDLSDYRALYSRIKSELVNLLIKVKN